MTNMTSTPKKLLKSLLLLAPLVGASAAHAVTLESEVKIADNGLHFNGVKHTYGTVGNPDTSTDTYDYFFGRNISAHGDAVKTYKHYVFMTWYRGGKDDRHVMLTRYNTLTGTTVDIEFPHQHTGFRGDPLVGESHNTIGLSVSPVNGTIHMVYDMHAYDDNTHDGKFKDDYFRYSYSLAGAAEVSDEEFTLAQFVEDTSDVSQTTADYVDYKHLTMTGDLADKANFAKLTYPKFFETTDGTLLLYMRLGGNDNGGYVFNRYDATTEKWSTFVPFNLPNAKNEGNDYNWGLYGNMKYVNGKLQVGFQQRKSDTTDKFKYQNGIFYAYSDHPEGFGEWKNHKGDDMTWPLVNSDEIKIFEPGDLVTTTKKDQVYIVGGFDWTVTAKGDVHFIHQVKDTENNKTVFAHTYKPAGASDFTTSTDFSGAEEIYTAGDNIYIVGLKNGKTYVEVAKGGTNDFTQVYEAPESDTNRFDHGTVHVEDGKVYYYLMEKMADGSISTAMPLYLQIIDLEITPTVSFAQETQIISKTYSDLSLEVDASIALDSRTITQVAFSIDGSEPEVVAGNDTGVYTWASDALQGLAVGTYTLKAIATDSDGFSSEATMALVVSEPKVEFAKSSISIAEGYKLISVSIDAKQVDGYELTDVKLYLNDVEIGASTTVPYIQTQSNEALADLAQGTYTLKAVVTDSSGDSSETTATLEVLARPNMERGLGGGGSTGLFWLACVSLLAMGRRTKS